MLVSLLLVAMTGSALAQNSAELFAPKYPVVAYAAGSDSSATTYLIACTTGSDPQTCDFLQPYTLIEGPKTLSFAFTVPMDNFVQSITLGCDLDSTTSLACSGTGASYMAAETTILTSAGSFTATGTEAASYFSAVPLVTNQASLLTYTPAAVSTSAVVGDLTPLITSTPTSIPLSTAASSTQAPTSTTKTSAASCMTRNGILKVEAMLSLATILVIGIF